MENRHPTSSSGLVSDRRIIYKTFEKGIWSTTNIISKAQSGCSLPGTKFKWKSGTFQGRDTEIVAARVCWTPLNSNAGLEHLVWMGKRTQDKASGGGEGQLGCLKPCSSVILWTSQKFSWTRNDKEAGLFLSGLWAEKQISWGYITQICPHMV